MLLYLYALTSKATDKYGKVKPAGGIYRMVQPPVNDKADFEKFKSEICNAKNIVYLTDNCGEIVLDKLLVKQIISLY